MTPQNDTSPDLGTRKPRKPKKKTAPSAPQSMTSLAAQLPQQEPNRQASMQRLPGGNLAGPAQPFAPQQAQPQMMGMSPQLGGTSLPGNGTTGLPGTGTTGSPQQSFGGMQGMASMMGSMSPQLMGAAMMSPQSKPATQPPPYMPQTAIGGVVQGNGVRPGPSQQWAPPASQIATMGMANAPLYNSGAIRADSSYTGNLNGPNGTGQYGPPPTPERLAAEQRARQFAMSGQQMTPNGTGQGEYEQRTRAAAGPYG